MIASGPIGDTIYDTTPRLSLMQRRHRQRSKIPFRPSIMLRRFVHQALTKPSQTKQYTDSHQQAGASRHTQTWVHPRVRGRSATNFLCCRIHLIIGLQNPDRAVVTIPVRALLVTGSPGGKEITSPSRGNLSHQLFTDFTEKGEQLGG